METVIPPNEPIIQKAIVNGLIATVTLWIFWTPFILSIAVPLVNAQLKNGVCSGLSGIPFTVGNDVAGNNLLLQNTDTLKDENSGIMNMFITTCVIVVISSLYIVFTMIKTYNLDYGKIILFNFVMAIIIVIIELSFFIGVSTRYSPFVPIQIVNDLVNQVNSYFNNITTITTTSHLPPVGVSLVPAVSDYSEFMIAWGAPPTMAVPYNYIVYLWTSSDGNWGYANIADTSATNIVMVPPAPDPNAKVVQYQALVQAQYINDNTAYYSERVYFPY